MDKVKVSDTRRRFAAMRWLAGLIFVAIIAAMLYLRSPRSVTDLPANAKVDYLLVSKRAHTLTLFEGGKSLKVYRVALGRGGPGQKLQEGDNKVPEGKYRIAGRNANSAFHRALRISYPSSEQASRAQTRGVSAGGDIMIHGIRNGLGWLGSLQRHIDWTKGCIAVTDKEIEEIWRSVPDGTPIEIQAE